jgi:exodeoxyribonuclease VII small subunit
MTADKTNYTQAIERLDAILEEIDRNEVPLDQLAERVVEAAELLKRCKGVLTETESRVRDVLEGLEKDFGDAVDA